MNFCVFKNFHSYSGHIHFQRFYGDIYFFEIDIFNDLRLSCKCYGNHKCAAFQVDVYFYRQQSSFDVLR